MAGLRVLVVENEPLLRLNVEEMLSSLGHVVVGWAATANSAIAEAERLRPDVILMDIGLDGPADGAEAAQIIRERFDIPSLFVTGGVDREKQRRAMESRPLGYLQKPLLEADLKAVLASLAPATPTVPATPTQGALQDAIVSALTPPPAADAHPKQSADENSQPNGTDSSSDK